MNFELWTRSQAKYRAHWSGNDTNASSKINCMQLAQSLTVVVGKVYEYHIGKALHSAANL